MADTVAPDQVNHVNAVCLQIFSILAILLTIIPVHRFWIVRNFPALNIILVNDLLFLQFSTSQMRQSGQTKISKNGLMAMYTVTSRLIQEFH